jgi:PST family polysaccharide transporter
MQKELSFFWDTVYRLSLSVIDAVAAIVLCLVYHSVFMLILAMLVSAVFEVAISFIFFTVKPKLNFNSDRAKDIFAQMKGLNLSSILSYLQLNLDNILIGKLAGTTNLGYYYNSFQLSHTPNYELSKAVLHSSFPVFSKIGDDVNRLKNAFLKTVFGSMLFFILASLPLLIFPQILVILFTAKWQPAADILRPLVVAGLINSFGLVSYTLWYARKKYRLLNLHLGLNILLMASLVIFLTPKYGLAGASWAVLLSRLVLLPFVIWGVYQTLSVTQRRI